MCSQEGLEHTSALTFGTQLSLSDLHCLVPQKSAAAQHFNMMTNSIYRLVYYLLHKIMNRVYEASTVLEKIKWNWRATV
jgi:hypothetical protein